MERVQEMPRVGLGTHTLSGEECVEAVRIALECGLRMIDTAAVYKNEDCVAEGIRRSGVPRESIFLITKSTPRDMRKGYQGILDGCEASLQRLQTAYIDLYLFHWPGISNERPESCKHAPARRECWRAMSHLVAIGKVRHVGVSNFLKRHLVDVLPTTAPLDDRDLLAQEPLRRPSALLPLVNQIELHPLCRQEELVGFCRANGVKLQQYSPLAKGDARLLQHPQLQRIFETYFSGDNNVIRLSSTQQSSETTPTPLYVKWSVQIMCGLWGLLEMGYDSLLLRTTKIDHALQLKFLSDIADPSGALHSLLTARHREGLQEITKFVRTDDGHDLHVCWFSGLMA